ncbi:MAG: restriction endonuclease subunit S [Bacteroidaceae bacterium]|nr:restriction endonuclease subunit S [Bacteroidaceae bacterium]
MKRRKSKAMGLSKYKISKLISVCDERNSYGYTNFYGVNINKEFMPTWANTEGLDESKYKVVRKKRFVFSGMQTGRDECIRISMYDGEEPIIVSPAYTTFEVTREDLVIPEYFFMLFLSKEKDRFGAFCSDGSIRSNLDWERFVDFDITLPSIEQQRKYVDVYLALQNNLSAYQSKVEELKLVCDGHIDQLKVKIPKQKVGDLLETVEKRNSELTYTDVQGININKTFFPTVANIDESNTRNYKIVENNQFAFSGMQTGRDMCIRIALNEESKPVIISPAYTVFRIKDDNVVLSHYIMLWFSRKQIDRYGWFASDGSIRSNLDLERLCEIEIPIPDISVQREIVNIHKCYTERQRIAEALKEQLKNICPVLIRGSLTE